MFIEKSSWERLKKYIENLYWDEDRMSSDGVYYLNKIDNEIKTLEKSSKNIVYIITSNCINEDDDFNNIIGITTSLSYAKKLFKEEIECIKNDVDFKTLNAIDSNDNIDLNDSDYENSWIFEETEKEFFLYQNGEYNSNHFIVSIEQRELEQDLDNNRENEVV